MKSTMTRITLLFFAALLSLSPAQAKIFRNAYISFELPEKWKCKIEGTEWVCSSSFKKQAREAIIILTAKEAGPSDNLTAYEGHLKQSRLLPSRSGSPTRSKVLHVKTRRVADQNWIDGMHKGSEIPNYYTRYLATVRDRVAILVTFSAHVQHYTKYSSDFFRAIQSLRIVASKALVKRDLAPSNKDGEIFGSRSGEIPIGLDDFPDEESEGGDDSGSTLLGLILLALSGGGYFYLQKKKKGKKKS